MKDILSVSGIVTMLSDFPVDMMVDSDCYKRMSLEDDARMIVHFVIEPKTYVVDHRAIRVGDHVTGFYDANVPVPLIYPPQYHALVVAFNEENEYVTVDYFNDELESSDGRLRLHIGPQTVIVLENGQPFTGNVTNRTLIVRYGATTKSIPAQTTPSKIVVLCS